MNNMERCNRECSLQKTLFSKQDLDDAKKQFPNYEVITAEKIKHKGNRVCIDSRAIIYSPVGNQEVFWTISRKQRCIPKIVIIGFSTSKAAMQEFYYNKKSKNMDLDTACTMSAFSGSKQLRKNLRRMVRFLNLNVVLGEDFQDEKMFDPYQKHIFYTQIIKCCSLGKVIDFSNSSAIYPNLIDKKIKSNYLNNSGHRECIEKIFLRELQFSEVIPTILIFKPAWENLKEMGLLSELNGDIVDWIPHPSNPGSDVDNLLNLFENGEDFNKNNWKNSAKQLINLRNKLKTLLQT